MNRKRLLAAFLWMIICVIPKAQTLATFEVRLDKPVNGIQVPSKIDLDAVSFLSDSLISLVEVRGNKRIPVASQVEVSDRRVLHWLIEPLSGNPSKRIFELVQTPPLATGMIKAVKNNGALTIRSDGHDLLNYVYKTVYPPVPQDTNYKRSGFIHPLYTPHGQELTRIQAPDHYHHYGIWNPWTHVLFEKDTVDFWNIKGKQGTVRFAKFVSVTDGPVYSEYEALHEHVVFKKDGSEKVALNELQTVRVYKPEPGSNYYIVDITSRLNCATESPFLIMAYRYAGLGWRTTGFWNDSNCVVLTSEGNTRKNTDGTKARWAIVQGALENNDYGGAAFLSNPANYNHPEPMRIWVEGTNKRGDMFFSFAPTKDRDWLLLPGKTYTLRYRLVVFNDHFSKEKAESAWQYFAHAPEIKVIGNQALE